MALIVPPSIVAKIATKDHGCITENEVAECFDNHCGRYCLDHRPQHADSNGNPSVWFVASTNHGRCLKIMFVRDGTDIFLASAYPATPEVQRIFSKFAK